MTKCTYLTDECTLIVYIKILFRICHLGFLHLALYTEVQGKRKDLRYGGKTECGVISLYTEVQGKVCPSGVTY